MSRTLNLLPKSSPFYGVVSRTLRQWWAVWTCVFFFFLALGWRLQVDTNRLQLQVGDHGRWLEEAGQLDDQIRVNSLTLASLQRENRNPLATQFGFPTLPFFHAIIEAIDAASKIDQSAALLPPGNETIAETSNEPHPRIVINSVQVEPSDFEVPVSFRVSLSATCPDITTAKRFTEELMSHEWMKESSPPSFPSTHDETTSCVIVLDFFVVAASFGDTP